MALVHILPVCGNGFVSLPCNNKPSDGVSPPVLFLFITGLSFKSKLTRFDDASNHDEAGSLCCFPVVDDVGG